MGLYKVDETTADLTLVAGGTLYADAPICSWIKNNMDSIPSGFLKEGDTISATEYPELYAKYGSTVPYKADTSELSEYEPFTISTTASTLPYDGFMSVSALCNNTRTMIFLNDQEVARFNTTGSQDPTVSFSFKKGDAIRVDNTNATITNCKVAYYKKSLVVKAKQVSVPFDVAEYIRNQNVLSEWEAITIPTTEATSMTMMYDGYITCAAGRDTSIYIYVDGHVEATSVSRTSEYAQPSINGFPFKKGQAIYVKMENGSLDTTKSRVAYYKLRDYTGR